MITREQLQDILAHDGPTDIWVLEQTADGYAIKVVPDQDLAPLQDPATWPKYLCRSEAVDNIVLGMGWEPAVDMINRIVTQTILARPAPTTIATRIAAAIKEKL